MGSQASIQPIDDSLKFRALFFHLILRPLPGPNELRHPGTPTLRRGEARFNKSASLHGSLSELLTTIAKCLSL